MSGFAQFDLDPSKNEFLFYENGRPRIGLLGLIALLAFMLWTSAILIDPKWHPTHLRGKGAWIIALLLLTPIAVRAAVCALATGWMAELGYRKIVRSFDGKPDFLIGASGVADLSPWAPQTILWSELLHVGRVRQRATLFTNERIIAIQFVAERPCPSWLPPGWWRDLPASLRERRIGIAPSSVGLNDQQLLALVARYSDRLSITERTI